METTVTERDTLLGIKRPSGREKFLKSFNISWLLWTLGFLAAVAFVITICMTTFGPSTTTEKADDDQLLGQSSSGRRRSSSISIPSVTTSLGRVDGVNLTSREGREYFGFYNIPYAKAISAELRFKEPEPPTAWEGTLDGSKKGIQCMQKDHDNPGSTIGTESCLQLNIFTPKLPSRFRASSFPVIVYNGGGGFTYGAADDIDATYFMDEDVVFVTVDSRLGALGFLNTGDGVVNGNLGFKDQVQALKFISEHVSDFGGDPNRIVAFGSSSGAMGAMGHLLSPMTKGLLSGVISFSGNLLTPGSFNLNPGEKARELGEALNCSETEDSQLLLDCLRNNKTAEEITLAQPIGNPSLEFVPENGDLTNIFLPDSPYNLVMEGKGNAIPLLIGVNSAEMIRQSYALLANQNATDELNNNFNEVMKELLELDDFTGDEGKLVEEMMEQIHELYFGNETISKNSLTRYNLTNVLSDRSLIHPTKVAGFQHAQQNPVYWYYLTKEANVTWAKNEIVGFDPPFGVSHADEIQYICPHPGWPYISVDDPLFEFSKKFVKFLVSFAETGAPVNPETNGAEWSKVDPSSAGNVWFNLDDTSKPVEPFTERLALWDSFSQQILYNSSTVGDDGEDASNET